MMMFPALAADWTWQWQGKTTIGDKKRHPRAPEVHVKKPIVRGGPR